MDYRSLYPTTRQRLRKVWLGAGLATIVLAVATIGSSSSTKVNGQVTSSSTVDLGKLVGGPLPAWVGLNLLRTLPDTNGRAWLRGTGAVLIAVGAGLFTCGLLRL